MAHRSHSKISKLEPELRETVEEMIKSGVYYKDIAEYIRSHGISISATAVGDYARKLMTTLDNLRMTQENFRILREEMDRCPDLDITDGILQLLSNHLLDAINRMPEEKLGELDFESISKNAVALTRAAAYKRNVDVKVRGTLENGADQFMSYIYETMAVKDPELLKKVKKFVKSETKDG